MCGQKPQPTMGAIYPPIPAGLLSAPRFRFGYLPFEQILRLWSLRRALPKQRLEQSTNRGRLGDWFIQDIHIYKHRARGIQDLATIGITGYHARQTTVRTTDLLQHGLPQRTIAVTIPLRRVWPLNLTPLRQSACRLQGMCPGILQACIGPSPANVVSRAPSGPIPWKVHCDHGIPTPLSHAKPPSPQLPALPLPPELTHIP